MLVDARDCMRLATLPSVLINRVTLTDFPAIDLRYARERTAALFQGRPCIIDEECCSIELPSTDDFPADQHTQAQIFVHWVQLCRLMGQVQKQMLSARQTGIGIATSQIAASLTGWLNSIPEPIKLSISTAETVTFRKDVHLLHLPYLTTIALVYLNTTGQDYPEISIAAVLAATCTARIIRDFLLHGAVRALPEDTGWSIAIAVTALMHVCLIPAFDTHARTDIRTLLTALEHMSATWTSSNIMLIGLRRLIATSHHKTSQGQHRGTAPRPTSSTSHAPSFVPGANGVEDLAVNDGFQWAEFFPFASAATSPSFHAMLEEVRGSGFQQVTMVGDPADTLDIVWSDFVRENPEWAFDAVM